MPVTPTPKPAPKPPVTPKPPVDCTPVILDWCDWGVKHHGLPNFHYSEGADRMSMVNKPGVLPWAGDCSSWVTCVYAWSGCADPSGTHFAAWDNTTSIAAHGKLVAVPEAGDIAIFSANKQLPFAHAALVYRTGSDPLLCSMGQNGDPSFVHRSQDPRPVKYYRFDRTAHNKVNTPPTK